MHCRQYNSYKLGEIFWYAATDLQALTTLTRNRLRAISTSWACAGSENAQLILDGLNSGLGCSAILDMLRPLDRIAGCKLLSDERKAIRTLLTSGSSGVPLRYGISQEWRWAHHATWRLAYLHMSGGALEGYLDPRFTWAMARPPGGTTDGLAHLIECIPSKCGISFTTGKQAATPNVVHGSVTTILELLEYAQVRRWRPIYVVLTYEQCLDWQMEVIHRYWPEDVRRDVSDRPGRAVLTNDEDSSSLYFDTCA